MVVAYVMIESFKSGEERMSVNEALKYVQERHPSTYPNKHFMNNMRKLHRQLVGPSSISVKDNGAEDEVVEEKEEVLEEKDEEIQEK